MKTVKWQSVADRNDDGAKIYFDCHQFWFFFFTTNQNHATYAKIDLIWCTSQPILQPIFIMSCLKFEVLLNFIVWNIWTFIEASSKLWPILKVHFKSHFKSISAVLIILTHRNQCTNHKRRLCAWHIFHDLGNFPNHFGRTTIVKALLCLRYHIMGMAREKYCKSTPNVNKCSIFVRLQIIGANPLCVYKCYVLWRQELFIVFSCLSKPAKCFSLVCYWRFGDW